MNYKDPLTGEEFIPIRTDQKFATRKNQVRYNNEKAKAFRKHDSSINKQLRRNLKILIEVVGQKKEVTLHKQFLLGKGFTLSVHTHVEEWQGSNHFAVYQFIFVLIEQDQIKIIRK